MRKMTAQLRRSKLIAFSRKESCPLALKQLVNNVMQKRDNVKLALNARKEHRKMYRDVFIDDRKMYVRIETAEGQLSRSEEKLTKFVHPNVNVPLVVSDDSSDYDSDDSE